MGFLDGLLGNASEIPPETIEAEFGELLAADEQVFKAYQLIRDFFIFTDFRLLLVDKQGLTGKKIAYHSVPYRNITHFIVETSGHLDLDAELKIWVSGSPEPLQQSFSKKVNVYEVQALLADMVRR
jgi:hypothetical protein